MNRLSLHILFIALAALTYSCLPYKAPEAMATIYDGPEEILAVGDKKNGELRLYKTKSEKKFFNRRICQSITDITSNNSDILWVLGQNSNGSVLYELHYPGLTIADSMQLALGASSIIYNSNKNRLWITSAFTNKIEEIDLLRWSKVGSLVTTRHPVGAIAKDSLLFIAGHVPSMAATDSVVAVAVSIINSDKSVLIKEILLPNGSTLVGSMVADNQKKYGYITHILAHYQLPPTQTERSWITSNALSIISLDSMQHLATVLLDSPQKGAANPWGAQVSPDDKELAIALSGTSEVMVLNLPLLHKKLNSLQDSIKVSDYTKTIEDTPNDLAFLYNIRKTIPTSEYGTRGVIYTKEGLIAANYFSGSLSIIKPLDGTEHSVERFHSGGRSIKNKKELWGEALFCDANLSFQSYLSCSSCHGPNGRTDGLNWDLRNDGLGNPKNTKSLLLAHQTAPSMALAVRENSADAVRQGIRKILFTEPIEEEAAAIDAYISSLKSSPSPYLHKGELTNSAKMGKELFKNYKCAECHSSENYTNQKSYQVYLPKDSLYYDTPTLKELWLTAPYLYDGRAATLEQIFTKYPHASIDKISLKAISPKDISDISNYMLSL